MKNFLDFYPALISFWTDTKSGCQLSMSSKAQHCKIRIYESLHLVKRLDISILYVKLVGVFFQA